MDELDELRQKRLREMFRQEETPENESAREQIQQLEQLAKNYLTKGALERFGNVKAAHPQKAMQVLVAMAQLIRAGNITSALSDDEFKLLLQRLEPQKKEFRIRRS